MENNNKEDIYARWLAGSLTREEMERLELSGEAAVLRKIIEETDSWTLPDSENDSLENIKLRIKQAQIKAETKVVPLYRRTWFLSAAASLFILITAGLWFLNRPQMVTYTSAEGSSLKVYLPDSTVVVLTGASSLSFDSRGWEDEREIDLKGAAYFDVKRKGSFEVAFAQGKVMVLGTRFDILSGSSYATVRCYEGKVKVVNKNGGEKILQKGEGVGLLVNEMLESIAVGNESPEWLKGESVFRNAPLAEVISAIEVQYNVNFETGKIDLKRRFTGKFVHNNLRTALEMVFVPMGIEYEMDGRRVLLK